MSWWNLTLLTDFVARGKVGGGGADAEEGKHCLIRHAPQIRFQ